MTYKYYHGPRRIGKAKELRRTQTKSESILWERLRGKKLSGYKFRRQHVIYDYIVDFYCAKKMLVIEIDGPYHDEPEQKHKDQMRDLDLQDKKYTVIRFSDHQVINRQSEVLEKILEKLISLPTIERNYNYKTTPSRDGGESSKDSPSHE